MQGPAGGALDPTRQLRARADQQPGDVGEALGLHRRLEPAADGTLNGVVRPSPQRFSHACTVACDSGLTRREKGRKIMTATQQERPERSAADGSPLDVMLTDAAVGPVRRLLPGRAGLKLAARLAARPLDTTRVTARVALELGKVIVGVSQVEPGKRDKRFADPAWTGNPVLHRLCQGYLVAGSALERVVEDADLDWRSEQQMRFVVQMVVDAMAPSNNPLLNPLALKTGLETGGRSYLTGARQFVQDMATRPRIPSMVDGRGFSVGGNLAVTEGAVVLRTPIFELIHYRPRTEQVLTAPLLVVPPMINKFYIADLAPDRSMVAFWLDQGQQVFAVSWRNPSAEHRAWDLDTYAGSVLAALDAVEEITGSPRSHVLGLCAGGIVTSCAVSHLVASGRGDRIAGLTLGVTLLDQERAGTVGSMVDANTAQFAVAASQRKGYLDGKALAGVFAWLRPNDLIWNYWVNNYLLGKRPPAFDVLVWNADTTRMPAGLHRDFIRMTLDNALTHPGSFEVLGAPVDLSKIDVDSYVVAGSTDHICPWDSCYRSAHLLGGDTRFVLSTAGHIAALVNPPTNPKSNFRVNDALPASGAEWLAGAVTHPGSWWTDHAAWLAARSG
ncbi:MAG: alpha/beta fold hydrolase, partial [Frankiales bacterium]|nr:alpha/beta fold hydrolase [Frankiales bacterium]